MAKNKFELNKSDDNFSVLVKAYGDAFQAAEDPKEKQTILVDAIKICEAKPQHNMALVFATELVKLNPTHELSKVYFLYLIDNLKMRNKDNAAIILETGYLKFFGKSSVENQRMFASQPGWARNIPQFMKEASQKIKQNPDSGEINVQAARDYVDYCEMYAISYPKNPETPEYLFKAAEIARSTQDISKTIGLYDWIYNYFPTHPNAPVSLFLKAFTLETALNEKQLAAKAYNKFLVKYPNHDLAKDVKFSFENMNKTADQMVKDFEKKK
jgi:tetratricopeptide (TPR) repeat protein